MENIYGTSVTRAHSLEPRVETLTAALRDLYKLRHVPKKKKNRDNKTRSIGPPQRPLPDNTQYLQETNSHDSGEIRTRNPSKRATADSRLRLRGPQGSASFYSTLIKSVEI